MVEKGILGGNQTSQGGNDVLVTKQVAIRTGTASGTFGSTSTFLLVNVAINPPLEDATLTNWLPFASINNSVSNPASGYFATARITSTTNIAIQIARQYANSYLVTFGTTTVDFTTFSTDLAGVADAAEPHKHNLTTVSSVFGQVPSGQTITLVGPSTTPTVNIAWMIIHI